MSSTYPISRVPDTAQLRRFAQFHFVLARRLQLAVQPANKGF
jgi:hypothetical protein